jgi:uncharacterized protein (TIRG00374 family)
MKSSRSKLIYWTISLLIAVPLLYLSFQDIDWARVRRTWSVAQFPLMAGACSLITVTLFLRSLRWRLLLLADRHVTIPAAFWATSAGYFGNNFLPARAGELIRTMMVSSRSGLSRMYVLTTALAERMIDALVLLIISVVVVTALPSKPAWLAEASKPFSIIGVIGVLGIVILPYTQRFWLSIIGSLPLPAALSTRVKGLLDHVLRAIRSFHDTQRLLAFLALTCIIWCIDAVTMVTVGKGLGLEISLRVSFLLIAALGLGSALPSTPGYVGVFQFIAVSVLVPFGLERENAIAFILMFQALQYTVYGFWGVLAFWFNRNSQAVAQTEATQVRVL